MNFVELYNDKFFELLGYRLLTTSLVELHGEAIANQCCVAEPPLPSRTAHNDLPPTSAVMCSFFISCAYPGVSMGPIEVLSTFPDLHEPRGQHRSPFCSSQPNESTYTGPLHGVMCLFTSPPCPPSVLLILPTLTDG